MAGTGLGLMYVPAVCSVGYWFDKKRAFATGVVTSGKGSFINYVYSNEGRGGS